jgi:ABC-type proline/glycine betaine transport system permease subunit
MSKFKYLVPAVVLLGGLLVSSTTSFAKPEYVKTTKKACTFCHVDSKAKPKELTEAGKYFKEHNNSLEGYKAS